MTTELIEKEIDEKQLGLVTIHESLLWDEDDPRRIMTGINPSPTSAAKFREGEYVIDMKTDSYIWCFTGPRGSGKTTLMTLFAIKCHWLYKMRLISNFPIECKLQRLHGAPEVVKAEPLDLFRLLNFDSDYEDCLIIIDEAADVISHLASMTWKNRLLNIFVRQLRKNHNSLFLGTQQFGLIDKSMRWQVDILCECTDASRKYGWPPKERGKVILARLLDNSGLWTGETWEEAYKRQQHSFVRGGYEGIGEDYEYFPRVLWGEKGKTAPVFDSWVAQDVWESLRKVDLNLSAHKVGEAEVESDFKQRAIGPVTYALEQGKLESADLYDMMGELTQGEKNKLGSIFRKAGVKTSKDYRYKDFSNCDRDKLLSILLEEEKN